MKFLVLLVLVALTTAEEDEQIVNKEFLDGYNKFAGNVYDALKKTTPGSIVVSPLSVDVILALAEYGSKGETSKQLVKGLGLPENKEKLREAITSLTPKLNVNESYTLTTANKIYIKENYKLNEKFQKFAAEVYNAGVESVNFENGETAAANINKWVADKTLQKINDLVSKDDFDKDTRAVLLNALYFQGEWITKFDSSKTKKHVFHLDNSAKTELDFMEAKSNFKYLENNELNVKLVELGYSGLDVTLTLVLPNDKEGLTNVAGKISQVLNVSDLKYESVLVKIPKIKIETKIEFKPILESLGIVNAFEDIAEFPEITEERLKISKVVQKALIEFNEQGTTAAAASAVILPNIRSGVPPKNPKEFIADRPFIFILRLKNVVLFIGHYNGK